MGDLDAAVGDVLEEGIGQRPVDDGGGEHVEVGAGGDHVPVVVAALLGDVVGVLSGVDAAGDLEVGIDLLDLAGRVGERKERLAPAELLHIVVHVFGHFIAVVGLELGHALGAAAGPVVGHAAGDGGDALGEGVVRLVPEEAVHLGLARQLQAQAVEVVAEGVGVEAGEGQGLAGQRGDLAVMDVVLQEQGNLLAAEVLADAPQVGQHAKAQLVRLFDDVVDVGEPEVHVELGDGQNHGVHAVLDHLLEVLFGVLHVVEAVVADGSVLDRHVCIPPIYFWGYSETLYSMSRVCSERNCTTGAAEELSRTISEGSK